LTRQERRRLWWR